VDDASARAPANLLEKLPGFLSAFAFRDYRLIWTGAFLSSVGTWIQDVALSWLIHVRMGDPVYLGLRAFASDAPLIAFMLVGGAAADRFDRRRILVASNAFQMAMASALGLLFVTGHLGIVAILVVAFLTGLAQSQSAPTFQAVLTSVVPGPQIPRAVALNSLQFNLSRAIGPAIAALLLARLGAGACFAANALSFVAVIVALLRIDLRASAPAGTRESLGRSLSAGLRHVGGSPPLLVLTFLAAAGSFLTFPLITYLPVIAGDVHKTGASGYSLLLSSFGLGAIAGALATAQRGQAEGRGRTLSLAFAAYACSTLGALLFRRQDVALLLLPIAGASLVTAFSTVNSLVQEEAPDAMRGRVLSIFGLAFRGGMPVGSLVAGALVSRLGATSVLAAFCAVLLAIVGVTYARSAPLRTL
jgi:predicted MFS family arabinose efflux permease